MLKFFQGLINKHLSILFLDENAKEVSVIKFTET